MLNHPFGIGHNFNYLPSINNSKIMLNGYFENNEIF